MNELRDPDEPAGRPVPALDPPAEPAAPAPAVDVAGFTAFYRAETGALVRFLLCMGARLADAADLAQDTMIDAYRAWPTLTHPRAWARRVASRKYGRRIASTETPLDPVDGAPLLPAHHDVTEWEQRHEILRLLERLPWRQRQVMAWTFDGYTPQEIAAELGLSPDAVRASLKLARRALANRLNQAGEDPR
jgi:RNA polymerase sigma-70 factor (ECF subfamily)